MRRASLLFCVLVPIQALALSRAPEPGPGHCAVEGVITSSGGEPVDGALVAAIGTSAMASSDPAAVAFSKDGGRFRIEGLAPGRYALTATAPGRPAAYLRELEARSGETFRVPELKFADAGWTVSGSVRDGHGAALPRPRVTASRISSDEGDLFEVFGDEHGRYAITLPKGTYLVQPRVDGYVSDGETRTLGADLTLDLDADSAAELRRPADDAVVAWTRKHAIPLRTVRAEQGLADMRPLKTIVGDARVVALGEGTHGTREFFQLKHRLLEFLATEMGFEIFAIEASWPESLAVNEYVRTGAGDPEKALAGMYFWTWDTHEVLDMIRWMRRYNADPRHAKKLRFYGFDMQFPYVAAQRVVEYMRRVDPEGAPEAAAALASLSAPDATKTFPALPGPDQDAAEAAVARLLERFARNRSAYASLSSEKDFAVAEHHLRIVDQAAKNLRRSTPELRDSAMAENIRWLLDQEPGARMVVWAHNGHVRFRGGYVFKPMGAWLKEMLGPRFVSIGFAFDQGSFQAVDLKNKRGLVTFTVPAAPPGSIESTLARAGHPIAVLDLRSLPASGPVRDWWRTRHPMRSIGAVYDADRGEDFFLRESVPGSYDGLAFVRSTTAATPNPTGRRPPPSP